MTSWGWRIPFLSGIVMVGIGLDIHLGIEDTPSSADSRRSVPQAQPERRKPDSAPILRVIKTHWRTILLAGGAFVLRMRSRSSSSRACRTTGSRLSSSGKVMSSASFSPPASAPWCVSRTSPPQRSVRPTTTVSDRCYRCCGMGLAHVRPHRHSQPMAFVARACRLLHRPLDDVRAASGALRGAFPDRSALFGGIPRVSD